MIGCAQSEQLHLLLSLQKANFLLLLMQARGLSTFGTKCNVFCLSRRANQTFFSTVLIDEPPPFPSSVEPILCDSSSEGKEAPKPVDAIVEEVTVALDNIRLSGLPESRWKVLSSLDIIQV